ncbi:MAG: phage tail protein [Pararhodobacter sp.]
MGGRNRGQITGYRYALGMHLALCHGPVDAIREIRVDGRTAWSVRDAGTSGGSSPGVETLLGRVTDMQASPAAPGETMATITFPGTLPGMRLGREYRLVLADGITRHTVTLQSVTLEAASLDTGSGLTRWAVLPAGLAFPAQAVDIREALPRADVAGASGGRIRIEAPELFGGESREGGITGDVDVLMGAPDQGANDYLAALQGGAVPGYRGLCSLVLRQVALGLNPYLKPWAVRVTRVLAGEAGTAQWYPEKAAIHAAISLDGPVALYIAFDATGSMNTGQRLVNARAAVIGLLDDLQPLVAPERLLDLEIVAWGEMTVISQFTARAMQDADFDAARAYVQGIFASGGTSFAAAVSRAPGFFAEAPAQARKLLFLISDGAVGDQPDPTPTVPPAVAIVQSIPGLAVYAFNIDRDDISLAVQIDTTPQDGVPVVSGGDPEPLRQAMRAALGNGPDMNPAHIIRECLTNRDWGLGHPEAEIGESFIAAADTLHAEGFGLSLLWQQDGTIEAFIADVLDHIDATLFIDRRTGLWALRLIRADYDPADLPVFDESTVVDWGRLGRRAPSDLVNSVTVRFTDAGTDDTGAVSITDTARVQAMGAVIATTLDYPGIRSQALALRVAERDLRALSAPLLSGEITVTRAGADLAPGDVIRLRSSRLGLEDVVMRLSEIGQGDGRDNGIRLKLAEDVFALGATAIAGGRMPRAAGITGLPRPLARRLVMEAPWWLLVRDLGHAEADRQLADDPDAGALLATGERPSADALAAQLWVDPGTGPVPEGAAGFAPTALLAADVSGDPEDRVIPVTGWRDIGGVATGTLASIGGELVRVDGIAPDAITVGRGCLDTLPRAHGAGSPVIFLDAGARITDVGWAAGETLAVRLLPETGRGTLAFARAPEDSVTLDRRALRPLPAGRVQAGGSYTPDPLALALGDLALTWAHRDRLTQTSPVIADHTAGDIGPEPGVGYGVELRWVDPDSGAALLPAAATIDAGSTNSVTLTAPDLPDATTAPAHASEIEIALRARRLDGSTWVYAREHSTFRFLAPFALGWGAAWGANWGG